MTCSLFQAVESSIRAMRKQYLLSKDSQDKGKAEHALQDLAQLAHVGIFTYHRSIQYVYIRTNLQRLVEINRELLFND